MLITAAFPEDQPGQLSGWVLIFSFIFFTIFLFNVTQDPMVAKQSRNRVRDEVPSILKGVLGGSTTQHTLQYAKSLVTY